MSHHQRLEDRMRWRIMERLEAGQPQREFHLTPSAVRKLWEQFQDTASIDRKPGQGRPRATTVREDHNFSLLVRRNRGTTVPQLSWDLYAATGKPVIRVTVPND